MPLVTNRQPEPIDFIDWGGFQLAMLSNKEYQQMIAAASDQRAVSRVEAYFSEKVENWPVAAMIWGQMLLSCAEDKRPSAEEAGAWSVIARKMNMPISFNAQGLMNVGGIDAS